MNKTMLSAAIAGIVGVCSTTVTTTINAAVVKGFTIKDVGSNASGTGGFSSTLDGVSGAFSFSSNYINVKTYAGTSQFTGDAGLGTILGEGAANSTGSFSTGFLFSSAPFVPFTFGSGFDADQSVGDGAFFVTSLDFGGQFAGVLNLLLAPDTNFPLQVLWSKDMGGGNWDVAMRWGHIITTAEDITGNFTGFTPQWVLEGTVTTDDLTAIPRITVAIDVPGGDTQECAAIGGTFVQLNADVSLFGGAELASVTWSIDGQPAGTGIGIEPFLAPGAHAIEVTAESTSGLVSSNTSSVSVEDTTAPDLVVDFVDRRSGETIHSIDRPNVEWVIVKIEATDICDPQPTTEGIGGFPVHDGDQLKIRGQDDSVTLTTNRLTLSATTRDDAGNSTTRRADLPITE